eukprot:scaffold1809_cov386-Prasinococcus_capsulatus_cf.AAC.61
MAYTRAHALLVGRAPLAWWRCEAECSPAPLLSPLLAPTAAKSSPRTGTSQLPSTWAAAAARPSPRGRPACKLAPPASKAMMIIIAAAAAAAAAAPPPPPPHDVVDGDVRARRRHRAAGARTCLGRCRAEAREAGAGWAAIRAMN